MGNSKNFLCGALVLYVKFHVINGVSTLLLRLKLSRMVLLQVFSGQFPKLDNISLLSFFWIYIRAGYTLRPRFHIGALSCFFRLGSFENVWAMRSNIALGISRIMWVMLISKVSIEAGLSLKTLHQARNVPMMFNKNTSKYTKNTFN